MKRAFSIIALIAVITLFAMPVMARAKGGDHNTPTPTPPPQKFETIVAIAKTPQEAGNLVDHYLQSGCKQVGQVMPASDGYSVKKGDGGVERHFTRWLYLIQASCPAN